MYRELSVMIVLCNRVFIIRTISIVVLHTSAAPLHLQSMKINSRLPAALLSLFWSERISNCTNIRALISDYSIFQSPNISIGISLKILSRSTTQTRVFILTKLTQVETLLLNTEHHPILFPPWTFSLFMRNTWSGLKRHVTGQSLLSWAQSSKAWKGQSLKEVKELS